ncbi:MAG: serine hydroxymethyltransferase [Alphaproteobacteria bacterium]|nr:serine hydroxymethyltransferase [Alphaproteobacteria bacterium]
MAKDISGKNSGGGLYFEFIAIGVSVKCTAIDPASGMEASVIGPTSALSSDLEKLAAAKLRRLIEKQNPKN